MSKYYLNLLVEGRLEDIKDKYQDSTEIGVDDIDYLSQEDPSGNNKYLEWMVKTSINGDATTERVAEVVKDYHENLARINNKMSTDVINSSPNSFTDEKEKKRISNNPKDINSFYSVVTLQLVVDAANESKKDSPMRDKIYEDDRFIVIVPKTHKASCKYGSFSNWCVSTSNDHYFREYTKEGMLAFIIWKDEMSDYEKDNSKDNDNVYKLAIHVEFENPSAHNWTFWNKVDRQMDSTTMVNLLPKGILDSVKKHITKMMSETGYIRDLDWGVLDQKLVFIGEHTDRWRDIHRVYLPNVGDDVTEFMDTKVKLGALNNDYDSDDINLFDITNTDSKVEVTHSSWSAEKILDIITSTQVVPTLDVLSNSLKHYSVEPLISQKEFIENFIKPTLISTYGVEILNTEREFKPTNVDSDFDNYGRQRSDSVSVDDLKVGDVVTWEVHKGRSSYYRWSDTKTITEFSGTITGRTPSGYIVIEMTDGTKKRFKSGKGKYMKVKREGTYTVMGLLDNVE
jgi:hypothetical protein